MTPGGPNDGPAMRPLLRKQLLWLSVVTSSTALLLACAAFVAYEVVTFREAMVRRLATDGEVVAANSTAAVLFRDAKSATETLSALRAERAIMRVELRLPDGSLLAQYLRKDVADAPPPSAELPAGVEHRFERDRLVLVQPITSEGTVIARLVLQSDLHERDARIRRYLLITALILMAAFITGFVLSRRLQHRISEPILNLVRAARTVSSQKDFALRVNAAPDGEVGLLGKTFNEMLDTIEHQDAELRRAVAARDDFLSIASHELRTPLTPLQLQVQKLQMVVRRADGDLAPRVTSGLEVMDRQVVRLITLVNRLLDISRITSDRLDLEREPMDLTGLVREVIKRSQQELQRAGCEVQLHADGPVMGVWDKTRLDQVFTNLLSNASKYGAGKPIRVVISQEGGHAVLCIQDQGIGIAPDDQARIFQRFERAVSTNNYGGFGLGLWIVRQIVEASGGRITVDSQPGKGATFRVQLPLDPAASSTRASTTFQEHSP